HLCRARPVGRETPTGGSLRRRSIALFGLRHRLDTALIDADSARRRYDRSPGIIGQRHATRKPLRPRARFRLAGREHFAAAAHGPRALHRSDIARDLARERRIRIHARGIKIERQHAVGERPSLLGRSGAAECTAEQFADQSEPGALVLAEGADRALALAVVARPATGLVISVEQMRVAAYRAVPADERIARQFLAAVACDQNLAFGHDRSGEIE